MQTEVVIRDCKPTLLGALVFGVDPALSYGFQWAGEITVQPNDSNFVEAAKWTKGTVLVLSIEEKTL